MPHEQKHEDWCIALESSKDFLSFFQLNNLSNLIPSLIACELAVDSSSNWRLHVQLLEKFSCFPKCLTSDQIYYKFVPLFFRLLSSNVSFIVQCNLAMVLFNPFNPLSDEHLISPQSNAAESFIKIMRIKKMIINSTFSWLLNKFSLSASEWNV